MNVYLPVSCAPALYIEDYQVAQSTHEGAVMLNSSMLPTENPSNISL